MEVLLLEMENSLRLEVVTSVRPEAVVDLYMDAGWWEEGWSEDVIPAMVANSFRFVALFDGSELVGMGRALSDASATLTSKTSWCGPITAVRAGERRSFPGS